jgi:hypothetical protein
MSYDWNLELHVLAKWNDLGRCDTHQHPPLPVKPPRGKSNGILFGVSRECVLCESVSSDAFDGLRGVGMLVGDVLLEGVSDDGDGLSLADELQYVYDIHATIGGL